jgi:hypothetical protein
MRKNMSIRKALKNNGLASAMFCIFLVTLVGMSVVGWFSNNDDRRDHHQTVQNYGAYILSGNFAEAVFENWESEFLQMWALVMLTVFLRQKGSTDSKPLRGKAPQDTSSRISIINTFNWKSRGKAIGYAIYSHSLGLVLLIFFLLSFVGHAIGGADAYNEMARQHESKTYSVIEYMGSSQFWFESLQNWQSEFLAVGSLLVLSIYLRERGSQQSKPIGKSYNSTTGE